MPAKTPAVRQAEALEEIAAALKALLKLAQQEADDYEQE